MTRILFVHLALNAGVVVGGCGSSDVTTTASPSATPEPAPAEAEPVPAEPTPRVTIPASLAPMGEGFPTAGAPCRQVGESAATVRYLDTSAWLVACPDGASAAELEGNVVAKVDGVILVSVPMARENEGLPEPPMVEEMADVADPKTGYHATARVQCGFGGGEPTESCPAGVKRYQGENGESVVEVTRPQGGKRSILFRGTTAYGATDGPADWTFEVTRNNDVSTVEYGPETYVIVDALVVGG